MRDQSQQLPKGGGLGLPRLWGIEVRLDYSWFIVFALVLWTLSAGYFPQMFPGQQTLVYWVMGLVSAVLLFGSVLTHELSHALAARQEGLSVPRITLFIFGGMAHLSREPSDPGAEFRIAAIGPVTSYGLAGLFWGLSVATTGASQMVGRTFWYLALANFILATFNLFPGFPLDGGRVLRAWLWHRWKDLRRATAVVTRIGRSVGTGLMLLGLVEFLSGVFVGGLWMVFIGLFLRQAAAGSYRMTALQELLRGERVYDLMRREPVHVGEALRLDELVSDYFYRYRYTSFPVTRGGRLAGLVHINQVKEIPQERWGSTLVSEVMTPEGEVATVGAQEEAFEAFRRMTQSGRQKLPVIQDGRLVGMVTARDILELFRIKSDLSG